MYVCACVVLIAEQVKPSVKCYLADCQGSALYYAVTKGVCYSPTQDEGLRKRHQVDTITEGIGLYRLTDNFCQAIKVGLDGAFKGASAVI